MRPSGRGAQPSRVTLAEMRGNVPVGCLLRAAFD
jgi:hypothetical protein